MFDIVNCVLRPIFGQREGGNDVDLLVVEKWSRGLGVAIVFLVSRHESSTLLPSCYRYCLVGSGLGGPLLFSPFEWVTHLLCHLMLTKIS